MEGDYYKTKETVKEYIRLAKDVDGGELINKLKEHLPSNTNVLEIGTGPGKDFLILKEFYTVIGSDNSTEFLRHLIDSNPQEEFLELDAISLKTDKKFDGIYSNKVLHHLKNEELMDSIKRQTEVLTSKGIICHSFWNGEGSEVFKGLFVNYHSEMALKGFFDPYFEILLLETYAEFEEADSILLIGKKSKI
ncbi:MAG: class I SAM-dependent methyltransferase [Eudoraea sp.]|uniref:class I SAM-dependent methyltransferase n=1 Tax=Eudoraea sp. TaxID=1979955 RepID=UPI003C74660A